MLRRTGHPAQRVSKPGRDCKDAEHLDEIRERRGILERMGAVGVEKASTIGTPFLDDFLRCDRALRDYLIRNGLRDNFSVRARGTHLLRLDQFYDVIRLQILGDALPHQQKCPQETSWK